MKFPLRRARATEASFEGLAAEAGVAMEEFMREVAEFRVALDADLTIAAAAADLGEPEFAADLLETERRHLANFHLRALRSIAPSASNARAMLQPMSAAGGRVRRPRMAMAAALALVTALGGAFTYSERPGANSNLTSTLALAAAARYAQFSALAAGDASASEVIAAAAQLHSTLADLVRQDPNSVNQVAGILTSEQEQLLQWLPPGTTIVLADAQALIAQMRANAPANVAAVLSRVTIVSSPPSHPSNQSGSRHTSGPTPQPQPRPTPQPEPQPTTSAAPRPTTTPSPQPSRSPSHPTNSPSPSPSSPVLPGAPNNPLR